jgi:hypothetical protein
MGFNLEKALKERIEAQEKRINKLEEMVGILWKDREEEQEGLEAIFDPRRRIKLTKEKEK